MTPIGNTATGYTGTVHFTSSDAQAVLPADYTFMAGDAGVHTFIASRSRRPGTQTITATDTVTGSITGTQSGITVNAAAAAKLGCRPAAGHLDGRQRHQPRHRHGPGPYGNTATGYTGTVHFTSSDRSRRSCPANYTFERRRQRRA